MPLLGLSYEEDQLEEATADLNVGADHCNLQEWT